MKIEYKTTLRDDGTPGAYTEVRHELCCEGLNNQELFEFGQDSDERPLLSVSIVETELGYYGDRTTLRHPISFCPFCGTKIVLEEVQRVRLVETKRTVVKYDTIVTRHEVTLE